ncbi:MAG TPA: aldo/keto reductase [bacterium]|nr:aldo/keto reductase [bacterium]HPP00843.1 aldo/keto reductase [bacterium]HXK94606.1 aldo/keto reductase [bacterium]
MSKHHSRFSRRTFLRTGVTASVAMGMGVQAYAEAAPSEKVDTKKILNYQPDMRYRRLGNTDIYLSVISLGGLVNEPGVHAYGIDRGVNLVHISDSYLGGRSIRDLGEVMKSKRDKVYIALKDNFFSREDYRKENFKKIDDILKLLNTDYVDFFMFNRHDAESAKDPLIGESFEKLKQLGKVRFAGFTNHGDIKGGTAAAVESGMYHLLNPVLSQDNLTLLDAELRAAREKGMGVMGMKTMKGLRGRDQELAYLKKLLSNPAVTTVVKGIGSVEMFDAYLKAAGETLTSQEDKALYHYAQANRSNNCLMCDECKRNCPECIEISTVIRCKDYYFEQLGDRYTAFTTYQELPEQKRFNSRCGSCRKCEQVCPHGIQIVNRLEAAKQLFA